MGHKAGHNRILALAGGPGLGIRRVGEGHLRVQRHPAPGKLGRYLRFDLLLKQKARVGHAVAHLHEVVDGQVGHGIVVGLALGLKFGKNGTPSVIAVLVQQLVEHGAVLKPRVHALAVKGHDGVGRVAEQQHVVAVLPRVAADGDHRTRWMRKKLLRQGRHQRRGVRKNAGEECGYVGRRLQGGEALGAFKGKEQSAIERAVEVGQRNHQVLAAGPDMQRIFLELPRAARAGGNGQLLVAIIEEILRVIEPVGTLQGRPHGRESAIGAKQAVVGQGLLFAGFGMAQAQLFTLQIDAQALLTEVDFYAGLALGQVEQAAVEVAAVHGVDGLALVAVGLAREVAVHVVHHAAAHGNAHVADVVGHAHTAQGLPAPVRQGQVDGAALVHVGAARVGPALEHLHGVAPTGQIQRQQRAHQAGPHNGNGIGGGGRRNGRHNEQQLGMSDGEATTCGGVAAGRQPKFGRLPSHSGEHVTRLDAILITGTPRRRPLRN